MPPAPSLRSTSKRAVRVGSTPVALSSTPGSTVRREIDAERLRPAIDLLPPNAIRVRDPGDVCTGTREPLLQLLARGLAGVAARVRRSVFRRRRSLACG